MTTRARGIGPGGGGFRPEIQGLRAVAVGVVVLYHAGVPILPGGYVGVDVFFVISGFLITGQLLRELGDTGRVGFAGFYARRARRILPASFVVLALTVIASLALAPPLRLAGILRDATATALYVPNMWFAAEQTDYLADATASPFQHYWSLGVEEQFYLVWPLLILLAVAVPALLRSRLGSARIGIRHISPRRQTALQHPPSRTARTARTARTGMFAILSLLVAASFAVCLLVSPVSQPWAFFSLPTRAWELGVGGLLAVVLSRRATTPVALTRGARPAAAWRSPALAAAGWVGLAAIGWSASSFTADTTYPGAPTVIPVLGAALVIAAGQASWGPGWMLARRPLQVVGAISYSLYLVHWPVLVLAGARTDSPLPLAVTLLLALGCIPLAWGLYRWVELPLRERRVAGDAHAGCPRRRPRVVLGVAAAASVLLVATLTGAAPAVATAPLTSSRAAADAPLEPLPAGTDFVPANVHPSLAAAVSDTGALYTDGCQQSISRSAPTLCSFGDTASSLRIVLFGDSHAGRWFPALEAVAGAEHARLDTYVKSGCHSVDLDRRWPGPAGGTCTAWRVAVLAALAKDPPDVIILTNHLGLTEGGDWDSGIAHSIARLPRASTVVTLADTPEFTSAPADCLSVHLDDASACAGERGGMFNRAAVSAEQRQSIATGSAFLDLSDYFCGTTSCPAVIGRTLVYADENHFTATFSRQLAVPLGQAIAPYLRAAAEKGTP